MTAFWLIGLCLLALSVVIVLSPYLRGKVSGGVATPILIALGAPILTVALYLVIGTPQALDYNAGSAMTVDRQPNDGRVADPRHMAEATAQLAARLRDNPNDLQGWLLLGRARASLGQAQASVAAFKQAHELAPNDPTVLVQLAQAIGYANNYNLTGEPRALLEQAVRTAPNDQRALWYAGIAAYQAGDFVGAVSHWERLLPLLEPGGEVSRTVEQQLTKARSQIGNATAAPATRQSPAGGLTVKVSLAPALRSQLNPGDTVFVFARAVSGPPMPLAVERHRASDLPLTVLLNQADAMTGAASLAQAAQVNVSARVSKSGNAIGRPGDLEGHAGPIALPRSEPVSIVIDTKRAR